METSLTFFITVEDNEFVVQLSEYDTVELLKIKIHKFADIPPHRQIITGWRNEPECENTILKVCSQSDITKLVVGEVQHHAPTNTPKDELEIICARSFVHKLLSTNSNFYNFQTCRLTDAILTTLQKRKVLLLYLHNEGDNFSRAFMETIQLADIASTLFESFFQLGWDIRNQEYHTALITALTENGLDSIVPLIKSKTSAALILVPIYNSLSLFACMRGTIHDKDFRSYLKNAQDTLYKEVSVEDSLKLLEAETSSINDINSENYQKMMADMLGDRDYDCFEYDQHQSLKEKIGFALYGPPKTEKGYKADVKEWKRINELYKKVLENSSQIVKYKDQINIAFIYNCTEPLPSEKVARAKKFPDYKPATDLMPVPIFVLRKCHGSDNPCRLFIDDTGRTYKSWGQYIAKNKLPKCNMILPKEGRYIVEKEKVLLETHLSPACSLDTKFLQGADIVNTAGGLISGGVFVAAAIPTLTVAPALLVAAGVTGLVVGTYAIGRSAYTLYDRIKHRESMSFANSEARGAYLNIVAGSLGFVGAGANVLVSQLVQRGVNIGQGASAIVNTVSIANVGASGVSLGNSVYDVVDQWVNENRTPSLLTIVQLSSSVLFFGNAVYNFKSCQTIVEETQTRTLQDINDSLRSNRHRKTFNKLLKTTLSQNDGNLVKGKADVIAAVRNIQNIDETFAVLTRSNKAMAKHGVKFSADGGEIRLNGVSVDMNTFASMNKKDVNAFLSQIPSNVEITPADTSSMRNLFSTNSLFMSDVDTVVNYAVKIMANWNADVKTVIINVLAKLLASIAAPIKNALDEIFPNNSKHLGLINMIMGFFGSMADEIEENYKKWKTTNDTKYYNPIFKYIDVEKSRRWLRFFETAVLEFCAPGTYLTEAALKTLVDYFYSWFANKMVEYEEKLETKQKRVIHSAGVHARKVNCPVCGGYYYQC